METSIIMEITDNTFARQFETTVEGLVSVEYSFRKKNIFKELILRSIDNEEFISVYYVKLAMPLKGN
jgi:hypothetical protein